MTNKNIILGIDASRNRSGGAVTYLINILSNFEQRKTLIHEIHIWVPNELASKLPTYPFLKIHTPKFLNKSLLYQLFWQKYLLKKELLRFNCNFLFITDASTVSTFKPSVVLNQDILAYEPKMIRKYGFSFKSLRLILIMYLQNKAFKNSNGVIFLTKYASSLIQEFTGEISNVKIIPHGSDGLFKPQSLPIEAKKLSNKISCLYVSPTLFYKNHFNLIKAVSILISRGVNIELNCIGKVERKEYKRLSKLIRHLGLNNKTIKFMGEIQKEKLVDYHHQSDIYLFASSCESFGISLLDAMSCGIPIASSSYSSINETLEDGGIYFDPYDVNSIVSSVIKLISDDKLRFSISKKAHEISKKYSWKESAKHTFEFIEDTYKIYKS